MSINTPEERTELTPKGRRTRDAIVAAAAAVFHERGAGAATLGDVRRAANVSSSQLYHYFTDKQDLVRAVAAWQASEVVHHQQQMQLDSLEAFKQWRSALVANETARLGLGGCPLGSLVGEVAETDAESRERIAEGFRNWARAIEDGLNVMRDTRELPGDVNTHALATGILAGLQGGLLIGQAERSADALDAALGNTITLLEALSLSAHAPH